MRKQEDYAKKELCSAIKEIFNDLQNIGVDRIL
jgi:hypothetical protein